jgi:phage terminase large subunit-like protein
MLRSERNIQWVEDHIRIPEGRFVGQPLKMAEFMKDDFRAIFDNPHGTRRAIISRGRKNAKTVETAILMLLFLCGPEMMPNSQLYSAAQSRDQAGVLFSLAAKMARLNPILHGALTIRDTAKEIFCPDLGSLYKALSAEASTAFGLSPRFVAHDELGQVKGPRSSLYEALETATAAQEDPLSVIISTQAPTDADLLSVLIDDAKSGQDPRTVLRINAAPMDADPFSEEAIKAANPAFDIFMNQREVLSMAEDARRMPSREAEFRNYVLNQRVVAEAPFVSRSLWASCGGEVADLKGVPVYGGLDLSATQDLTALVLIGRTEGVWHVKPTFWLPSDGLREKSRADRVPYDMWHKEGYLETTPGAAISYEYVAAYLRRVFDRYNVRKLAFDRWAFQFLRPWLEQAGFSEHELERFVEFGQGFQSMSPAMRDLEEALLQTRVRHGMHPVLTMCAANAVVKPDEAGNNRKLDKSKSTGRIDGMVALTMAFGVAPQEAIAPAPTYQMLVFG